MSDLFLLPFRPAFDVRGLLIPGARLYFYKTETYDPYPVWADAAQTTPLSNPVIANSAGVFPTIYLDDKLYYRVILKDAKDNLIDEVDPYLPNTIDGLTEDLEGISQNAADSAVAAAESSSEAYGYAAAIETQTGGYWYPTLADGVADTSNGESFLVVTSEGQIIIGYNNNGVGVERAEFLSRKSVDGFPTDPSQFLEALNFSAAVNQMLGQADDAGIRTSIGAQTKTNPSAALGDVPTGADLLPYFTGTTTAGVTAFTAFARSLLTQADAPSARNVLGAAMTPVVSGNSSSGVISFGTFKLCWQDATANGNTYTTVGYGGSTVFTSFAKAWWNGGAANTSEQDNNPFVSSTGLTNASVFSTLNVTTAGTLFAFGV